MFDDFVSSHVIAGIGDLFGSLPADTAIWTYLTIVAFVLGDAVFAVFPGETTIIAASVLAVDGELSIVLIIACAAVAAIVGDSIVFWIGRRGHGPLRAFIARRVGEERLAGAEDRFQRDGRTVVLLSRFVPGVRWAVCFTAGALLPYRRFLPASALGGTLWATQTALLAYLLGSAFDEAWVSIAASFGISTMIFAVVFSTRRGRPQPSVATEDA